MTHLSENVRPLKVNRVSTRSLDDLNRLPEGAVDICILMLPSYPPRKYSQRLHNIETLLSKIVTKLGPESTLITLGEVIDLVHVQASMPPSLRYQLWIAIKGTTLRNTHGHFLPPQHHFGALVHTRYRSSLRHTKTRIGYTYCPACDRTTKDYGGKKHTYHEYGTLMSDVWRDISVDLEGDLTPVINRFGDVFGLESYQKLLVLDCRQLRLKRTSVNPNKSAASTKTNALPKTLTNKLILGDCLEVLQRIPDNSIDFAFADPPYNLRKKYIDYTDDLAVTEYFKWCDRWIGELSRVLRPGRTLTILNIPIWAIRHFLYMEKILNFQSWIVWDAISFPVRMIMPSHYAILCFSKGDPRMLPGLIDSLEHDNNTIRALGIPDPLAPRAEEFCLRSKCIKKRVLIGLNDRGPLTDLWWDIHRLKHNTRRVDHPCQLPPILMYRLISLFTKPGEVVLDCFNGAGTTTLAAHQLGRKYIGIELSEKYHNLALTRHNEILKMIDPFRKAVRVLTAKNSPVPRMPKQKYVVPKKTLQLEVKRIATLIGRLPTRDQLIRYGKYRIEYYDKYFSSWGEVCAAARTTGMSETRTTMGKNKGVQLNLFYQKEAIAD